MKVGDRVKVYATLNGVKAESKGKIDFDNKNDTVILLLENGKKIFAHKKQCRKLAPQKIYTATGEELRRIAKDFADGDKDLISVMKRQIDHYLKTKELRFHLWDAVGFVGTNNIELKQAYAKYGNSFNGAAKKSEFVNSPPHYNQGKFEVIDVLEDWKLNFHRANAVKYIARSGHKDKAKEAEDLRKAIWYLEREIKRIG